jgi:Putative DNA-binding domain
MPQLFDDLQTLNNIQALIDESIRESEVLEYKTASSQFTEPDRREIAKDVTAMANSLGGVIIYGVQTDPRDKTRPNAIEAINVKNIESFERILNSQVQPPITGIRKKMLPADNPQVMVIDVPASDNTPHQSLYDKRYYRRAGIESIAMGHDLIAMHFGRKLGPLLSLVLQDMKKPEFTDEAVFSSEALLRVFVQNDGKRIGRFMVVTLQFPGPEQLTIVEKYGNTVNIDVLRTGFQARQYSDNIGVVHPSVRMRIADIGLLVHKDLLGDKVGHPFITWSIYADEMTPQNGSISLQQLGWVG